MASAGSPSGIAQQMSARTHNGGPSLPFPPKLLAMLEDPLCKPYLQWADSGASIVVFDPTSFARLAIPRYFKHESMPSFVRQLNMYGFHKVVQSRYSTQTPGAVEFSHPFFIRGRYDLIAQIKRRHSTKSRNQTASDEGSEDDESDSAESTCKCKCASHENAAELEVLRASHEAQREENALLKQRVQDLQQVVATNGFELQQHKEQITRITQWITQGQAAQLAAAAGTDPMLGLLELGNSITTSLSASIANAGLGVQQRTRGDITRLDSVGNERAESPASLSLVDLTSTPPFGRGTHPSSPTAGAAPNSITEQLRLIDRRRRSAGGPIPVVPLATTHSTLFVGGEKRKAEMVFGALADGTAEPAITPVDKRRKTQRREDGALSLHGLSDIASI